MGKATPTFQLRAGARESRAALVRRIPQLAPGGIGLLFATAEFGPVAPAFTEELARSSRGTWVFAISEAVWTEAGELSGEPALAGFVLPPGRHVILREATARDFANDLAQTASGAGGGTTLVLLGPNEDASGFSRELGALPAGRAGLAFGGRATGPLTLITQNGAEEREAIGLSFPRQTPARIVSSSACRLISPLVRVTGADGRALTELDDSPALEMLEQAAASLDEPSLLLLALAAEEQALGLLGRNIIARAIVGLDPDRRALILDPAVPLGARVALAARDRRAALTDLERHIGALAASARSSAPTFGVFLASLGRRQKPLSLDGEVRKAAARFPGLPLIGLTTTFEISPFEGRLSAHAYACVVALFSAVN